MPELQTTVFNPGGRVVATDFDKMDLQRQLQGDAINASDRQASLRNELLKQQIAASLELGRGGLDVQRQGIQSQADVTREGYGSQRDIAQLGETGATERQRMAGDTQMGVARIGNEPAMARLGMDQTRLGWEGEDRANDPQRIVQGLLADAMRGSGDPEAAQNSVVGKLLNDPALMESYLRSVMGVGPSKGQLIDEIKTKNELDALENPDPRQIIQQEAANLDAINNLVQNFAKKDNKWIGSDPDAKTSRGILAQYKAVLDRAPKEARGAIFNTMINQIQSAIDNIGSDDMINAMLRDAKAMASEYDLSVQ